MRYSFALFIRGFLALLSLSLCSSSELCAEISEKLPVAGGGSACEKRQLDAIADCSVSQPKRLCVFTAEDRMHSRSSQASNFHPARDLSIFKLLPRFKESLPVDSSAKQLLQDIQKGLRFKATIGHLRSFLESNNGFGSIENEESLIVYALEFRPESELLPYILAQGAHIHSIEDQAAIFKWLSGRQNWTDLRQFCFFHQEFLSDERTGQTQLSKAACYGYVKVFEIVLECGKFTNNQLFNSLRKALLSHQCKILAAFWDSGLDFEQKKMVLLGLLIDPKIPLISFKNFGMKPEHLEKGTVAILIMTKKTYDCPNLVQFLLGCTYSADYILRQLAWPDGIPTESRININWRDLIHSNHIASVADWIFTISHLLPRRDIHIMAAMHENSTQKCQLFLAFAAIRFDDVDEVKLLLDNGKVSITDTLTDGASGTGECLFSRAKLLGAKSVVQELRLRDKHAHTASLSLLSMKNQAITSRHLNDNSSDC